MRNLKKKLAMLCVVAAVASAIGGGIHWSSITIDDGADTNAIHWSR